MPLNLTFDHFEPTTVRSGDTINAALNQALNPPLIPVSGIPLGAFFYTQNGKGTWHANADVRILDDYVGGFSKYSLGIPEGMTPGEHSFKIMVKITFKGNSQKLIYIKSTSNFQLIGQATRARFTSIAPNRVSLMDFESHQYRVIGDGLELIDTGKNAFLSHPNTGLMRIRQINDDTLILSPAFKAEPLQLGHYHLQAYQKNGELCNSSAYLTIE